MQYAQRAPPNAGQHRGPFIKALFNSRLYFAYIMSVRLLSKMLGRTAMRVLVVEDNALLRHHLKVQLQELGHQVDAAEDAGSGLLSGRTSPGYRHRRSRPAG